MATGVDVAYKEMCMWYAHQRNILHCLAHKNKKLHAILRLLSEICSLKYFFRQTPLVCSFKQLFYLCPLRNDKKMIKKTIKCYADVIWCLFTYYSCCFYKVCFLSLLVYYKFYFLLVMFPPKLLACPLLPYITYVLMSFIYILIPNPSTFPSGILSGGPQFISNF